jgi:hypothetical protein
MIPLKGQPKVAPDKDLGPAPKPLAVHLPHDGSQRVTDSDLDLVVDRWLRLPAEVRAVIVALVRASDKPQMS